MSIAEELAKKQKDISISEFFERNKHILGFDSLQRALLTAVKEAVDNALDACEDAAILPDISVGIGRLGKDEFSVAVEDNGPGIVKRVLPNVFGKLLYGSRFHAIKQSRGQQGIGISGVVMYGQLSTGKPAKVKSKVNGEDVAYQVEIMLDTKRNQPVLFKEDFVIWDKEHGTRIEVFVKGRYISGKQSIYEYLKSTAIVNPHARISFTDPDGKTICFERASNDMPMATTEIKPHPQGLELGTLLKMAKDTKSYKLNAFLQTEFSRISDRVSSEICAQANVDPGTKPKNLDLDEAKRIIEAIDKVKIMAPQADCLSPIQERLIKKGLRNVLGNWKPDFYCPPITREPKVYSGNPFIAEVGIVYGGDLPGDQPVDILRYANKVPLLFQQGACAITKAIEEVDWRRYGLEQKGGKGIPYGPAVVMVHIASTKVPFTSESKEAVAAIPEMVEEMELALQACARSLKTHLNKKAIKAKTREKFEIVQKVLPEIAAKSSAIVKKPTPSLEATITKIMNVVWIDDNISYDSKKKVHTVKIEVYNYTPAGKRFTLHTIVPKEYFEESGPKPVEVRDDGKVAWNLGLIKTTEKVDVVFELIGLEQEDYDNVDVYVSGINPVLVIGAEPLPGDWELDYREKYAMEEGELLEEKEVVEEANGEVDYDDVHEALEDDEEESSKAEGTGED